MKLGKCSTWECRAPAHAHWATVLINSILIQNLSFSLLFLFAYADRRTHRITQLVSYTFTDHKWNPQFSCYSHHSSFLIFSHILPFLFSPNYSSAVIFKIMLWFSLLSFSCHQPSEGFFWRNPLHHYMLTYPSISTRGFHLMELSQHEASFLFTMIFSALVFLHGKH